MAALFVFALALLAVPAGARAWRRARRHAGRDAPATLLEFAVTGLPESHQDWGRAMRAELEPVRGAGRRWGFSLGCASAAGVIRVRVTLASRQRGGAGLRAVIGAAWLVVLSPTGVLKAWTLVPLVVALLGPGCVAVLAARAGGLAAAGTRAALWSGIVGGLLVITVWMTATYARDGRPYDPQLLRDLPHSGAPDLATLAVSDALGSTLTLLILIPLTALASGSLAARLPHTAGPAGTRTPPRPAPRS